MSVGPVRGGYYLPLDCPSCGRHRLEPEIHQVEEEPVFAVVRVTCEKCGASWPSEDEDEAAVPRHSEENQ